MWKHRNKRTRGGRGPGRVPTLTPVQWQKVAWSDELEFFRSGSAAQHREALWGSASAEESELCFGRWSAVHEDVTLTRTNYGSLAADPARLQMEMIFPDVWPLSAGYHHPVLRGFWGDVAFIFNWSFKSEPWRGQPQMCRSRHDSEPSVV